MDDTKFNLKVISREGVMYEGQVLSISSYNEKGIFDVLAQHANFISLISKGINIKEADGGERELKFDNALIRVKQNLVEVFLGIEATAKN